MEPRAGRGLPPWQAITGRRPEPWSCAAAPGRGSPLPGPTESKSPAGPRLRARARAGPFRCSVTPGAASWQALRAWRQGRAASAGHWPKHACFASYSAFQRAPACRQVPLGTTKRLPRPPAKGRRRVARAERPWRHGMPPLQPCLPSVPAHQTWLMGLAMRSVDAVRELALCYHAHHRVWLQGCHGGMAS